MFLHIIDRKTARQRGLKFYFTGKPCPKAMFAQGDLSAAVALIVENITAQKAMQRTRKAETPVAVNTTLKIDRKC